jgi:hypothetical protein
MDFEKNCVFLDEAGFNLHIFILGLFKVLVDISIRKPISVTTEIKSRRGDGKIIQTITRIGIKTEHYFAYLNNGIDVLDKNDMKGHYLIMDNASIRKPATIRNLVKSRGYKCAYLPSYSPFLNPIELFWSKVKYRVKRGPFDTDDTLTPRIMEPCSNTVQEAFQR